MAATLQSHHHAKGSPMMHPRSHSTTSFRTPLSTSNFNNANPNHRHSYHALTPSYSATSSSSTASFMPMSNSPGCRSSTPIQPYAFTSTPTLHNCTSSPQPPQQTPPTSTHLNSSRRHSLYGSLPSASSSSTPSSSATSSIAHGGNFSRGSNQSSSNSFTNSTTFSSSSVHTAASLPMSLSLNLPSLGTSQDDFSQSFAAAIPRSHQPQYPQPQQQSNNSGLSSSSSSSSLHNLSARAAPDRYRRSSVIGLSSTPQHQYSRTVSGGSSSSMSNPLHTRTISDGRVSMYNTSTNNNNNARVPDFSFLPDRPASATGTYQSRTPQEDLRNRRRSVHNIQPLEFVDESMNHNALLTIQPHYRKPSADSTDSRSSRPSSSTSRSYTGSDDLSPNTSISDEESPRYEIASSDPRRASSTDAFKRPLATFSPSPLSRPVTMTTDDVPPSRQSQTATITASTPTNEAATAAAPSPASSAETPAQTKLASVLAERPRSKTSKLRRAFSFGSAAEFQRVAVTNAKNGRPSTAGLSSPVTLGDAVTIADMDRDDAQSLAPSEMVFTEEDAKKIRQQEASGLGYSIYGRRLFSGSTDNLSVSSTASSASVMIRKMGRGMKKSTRSLIGLFRPKTDAAAVDSGVPGRASPLVGASDVPGVTVSMAVAEGERVSSPTPSSTKLFQKLQAPQPPRSAHGRSDSANSVVEGGALLMAGGVGSPRKSILKKRGGSPVHGTGQNLSNESSVSSTPKDDASQTQQQQRTTSLSMGGEDYFVAALKLRQENNNSPQSSTGRRYATFSSRLVVHETWPSQEYDRRGDIATCNRLTPLLAQQIKEELNSFKMEMEVHETSKRRSTRHQVAVPCDDFTAAYLNLLLSL